MVLRIGLGVLNEATELLRECCGDLFEDISVNCGVRIDGWSRLDVCCV